ncbi:MAG: hypothetical protein NUW24_15865 [Anaerolineae bacterium]|jgi:hypothetical protein|nr:hypothetical protein [Anaerolineae bacterium]MDH7475534.1 hypothetical protein [Anaerolineae bacterium]
MLKRVVVTLLLLLALVIIGCLQNTDQSAATPFSPAAQPTPEGDSTHIPGQKPGSNHEQLGTFFDSIYHRL